LTTHPWTFGIAYTNPQSSNIVCRIYISIMLKPTMPTLESFATPIGLALNRVNVSAVRASLTRVSGWNKNNTDTSNSRFVVNKQPELIKRPVICPTSLGFAARLLIQRLSNIGQVFKRQSSPLLFSFLNKLLTDIVIQPLLKALFSPRKPSQKSTTRPSALD
jgi:hypothetical protein